MSILFIRTYRRFCSCISLLIVLIAFSSSIKAQTTLVKGDITPGHWLGTINSNWSDSGNWGSGILPTALTDVVINPGGNPPSVNITSAACNNLTISPGANLIISTGNTLDIKGSATNSGTFTVMGEAQFSGSSQTLPAGTYANLEISGSGTKVLSGSININGVLTLTNGYLQLGDNDLSIGPDGSITNGSPSSFIITNGLGALKQANIGAGGLTGSIVFPVGISSSSYTPIGITNTGTMDEFRVHVLNGVNNAYDDKGVATGAVQTNFNVNRTWVVSETTPGGSNATLSFQWKASDEQPGFIHNNCFASHYTGARWQSGPQGQTANGTDIFTLAVANITSFSPFGVGSSGSILPVGLRSFYGKPASGEVQLQWKTENEWNLSSFEIQRSIDGSNYVFIGKVDAMNSAGLHDYSFTDAAALNNTVYYRLKQTSIENAFTYSPVIMFSGKEGDEDVLLYPNPSVDRANLTIRLSHQAKTSFTLFDNSGTLIRIWQQNLQAGSTAMIINLEGLNPGLYHLQLQAPNSRREIKLIKK